MLSASVMWKAWQVASFFVIVCLVGATLISAKSSQSSDPAVKSAVLGRPGRVRHMAMVSEGEVFRLVFSNYSKLGRPVKDAIDPVIVEIGLRIFGVSDFNERENTLVLDGYFAVAWKDENLVWNETYPHNMTEYLLAKADDVWQPDLTILNSPGNVYSVFLSAGLKAWIKSDGSVFISPASEIAVKCELDLALFPFDEQICYVRLESWNYPNISQQFKLKDYPFEKETQYWTENKQWEIVDNTSRLVQINYGDDFNYDSILFILKLRRKSLFYYINVIIPSLIIAIVEIVTFVLPLTEVIKIHISFTCLLAYSVFQGMIINDMPKSSDCVSLLSLYIDLQMAYIGVIALLGEGVVFVILRRADLQYAPPPNWLSKLARGLGGLMCVDGRMAALNASYGKFMDPMMGAISALALPPTHVRAAAFYAMSLDNNSLPKGSNDGQSSTASTSITSTSSADAMSRQRRRASPDDNADGGHESVNSKSRHGTSSSKEEIRLHWTYIAEVVERLNMWLYLGAIIITPAIMFTAFRPFDKNLEHLSSE